MKTKKTLGKNLQIGDKVIAMLSGDVLTIRSFDPGFMVRKSRLVHYKESSEWTTVYNDEMYEVVEQPADELNGGTK